MLQNICGLSEFRFKEAFIIFFFLLLLSLATFLSLVVVQLLSSVRLLQPHGLQPTRLLCPWDSPGKNTGVDCHFLLQGIFPTQELNPGLLHCRQIFYQLNYQGSPISIMLLLLLLSRFSRVRLCATPQTAAHQAPLSLGCSVLSFTYFPLLPPVVILHITILQDIGSVSGF